MSSQINLFSKNDHDPKEQYDRFSKLAIEDYEELRNQLKNHFQSENDEEELLAYKINIFAVRQQSEVHKNIEDNIAQSIVLPAVITYLTYLITAVIIHYSNVNVTAVSLIVAFVIPLTVALVVLKISDCVRKNRDNIDDINIKRALLFLEYFEIK